MKSFATSICPIKKTSRSEYDASPHHPRTIPASSQRGETITQPISKRFLSGVITGLRHGDLAYRCFRAISACRTIQLSLSNRPLTGPRPVFATATLPTGTSVPSPRGKAVIYHPFATATLPTGTPVPSPRAEQSHNLSQTGL